MSALDSQQDGEASDLVVPVDHDHQVMQSDLPRAVAEAQTYCHATPRPLAGSRIGANDVTDADALDVK
jgi:hypothetical protein